MCDEQQVRPSSPTPQRWLRGAGIALLLALSTFPADGAPWDKEPIYAAVREAAAAGRFTKSKMLGFGIMREEFTEIPASGGVLVGFECGVGNFVNIEVIYSLRAIYRTRDGDVTYDAHGLFRHGFRNGRVIHNPVKYTTRLVAKPGYALGGVLLRSGLFINGMALTFMRINGTTLDSRDGYSSPWVGDRTGGSEAYIGTTGAPVIGIYGNQEYRHVLALGLYYMQPAPAAAPVPAPPQPDAPVRAAEIEKPAEARDAAPDAPADADEPAPDAPAAKKRKKRSAGPNWLLIGVGGGAVPLLMLLLISFGRKRGLPDRDRKEVDGRPQPPRPPASAEAIMAIPVVRPVEHSEAGSLDKSTEPARVPRPATRDFLPDLPQVKAAPRPTTDCAEAIRTTPPVVVPPYSGPEKSGPEKEREMDWRALAELRRADEHMHEARKAARARNQVAWTLFGIAGLQLICGLIVVTVLPELTGVPLPKEAIPRLTAWLVGIAVAFAGLGFWARIQPLPAAAVGLILYLLLFLGDLQASPTLAMKGGIVKIAITAALVRAVKLGYRIQAMERARRDAGRSYLR